ncbi:derepression protein [Salmonella enterica subsp. enterica]|uniref:Derepression protein n=1 Tax=Salmonella enterica subsp. enterica serovar Hofit TaxID=2564537 RepID=A0A5W8MGP2_SALET|nr:derepression protein [Salmonella enterica]EBX4071066.1 derepression protein [Salmonella enterica subsp. enterica serovar Richmond]EBY1554711.1 derepression protein [Salmonella enterica subsp. enterica serovar Hofit]EBZ6829989.1 derepression protein [Salmonella enterica subsp. enterica serovar Newport]ECF2557222.1 derepression protein [Salmonella enterica subsp. enterica serovar Ahuza]
MANRKQRQSRAQVARIHTQTEINRRLHRAHTLALFLPSDLRRLPYGPMPLWLPSVLDYIADDIGDIQKLFNQPAHTA